MAKKMLSEAPQTAIVESNPGGWLTAPGDLEVRGPEFSRTAYVTFASTKGAAFGKLMLCIPDLQDGDPVLVLPEPKLPMKLNPFQFMFPQRAFQHWSICDSQGAIVTTTLSQEVATADRDYKEHIEACLLVYTPSGLVPARATFKTTKTNALHRAIEAAALAAKPEWGALSPAHKASLVAPTPWARFKAIVSLKGGTGRVSGYKYVSATSRIVPTALEDWQMIGAFFSVAENVEEMARVEAGYHRRVAEIKTHIE